MKLKLWEKSKVNQQLEHDLKLVEVQKKIKILENEKNTIKSKNFLLIKEKRISQLGLGKLDNYNSRYR